MKPAVLIIDNSPGFTGAFRSIWNYAQTLSGSFQFHFAIKRNSLLVDFLERNQQQFIRLPFIELRRKWSTLFYLPMLLSNSVRIMLYCSKHSVQIIHVNDLYNLTGIGVKYLNPSVKLVYHVRLLPDSYIASLYGIWLRIISRKADALITVSAVSKKMMMRYTHREIQVVHDACRPVGGHEGVQARDGSSNIRLLYPANYTPGKGHDLAILAFEMAERRIPGLFLHLVGDDFGLPKNVSYKRSLEDMIRRKHLDGKAIVDGFCEQIEDLMRASTIILNFSKSESFSMVCLEAISCGVPIISTAAGGPQEIIEDGVSGLLVSHGNLDEMADAIVRLSASEALRRSLSKNGIERAKKFSAENGSSLLSRVYHHDPGRVTRSAF